MLCDRLSLGGVETHVITLANRLAAEGHDVTVISGGGALVASLAGVRHIRLPLYDKKRYFYLSLRLRSLFKKERFDVVHAHTRFSAFLSRPFVKGRLVTTAHWVFETRFPKGTFTTWGDEVLAVSEDIATYLEKNYSVKRDRISVTVNGIDTHLFAPKKRKDGIKIVYCSRLDYDRADVAFLLLDILPLLPCQDFSIHFLGCGDRLEELKAKVYNLLQRHPTLSVTVWGGVTEVADHLCNADILIGVSRAALEGMAAGCAVILAGNEGYLSVFSPARAALAERSNFCCRGEDKASTEALLHDLSQLLLLPPARLTEMGKENRHYVESRYGVCRMAHDALAVYDRICKASVVLCGYYGFHNVGDDLLLRAMKKALLCRGYKHVYLLSLKHISFTAFKKLRQGYDLILGGGNLLQDKTSRRSLRFYLFIAKCARGRTEIHGGIGPLTYKGERLCAPLLQKAEKILCRTPSDLTIATRLGAKNAILSADAALSLPYPQKEKGESILLAFKTPAREEIPTALAFILSLCRTFGRERFLIFVMHPDDLAFSRRVAALCRIPYHSGGDTNALLAILAKARMVYASRLHAGIAALGMGIPFALWKGEEKNRFFIEDLKREREKTDFCTLFSFSDRPKALLPDVGMQEAKQALLRRI